MTDVYPLPTPERKYPEAVIDEIHKPNADYIEYGPDDVERSG